MSSSTIDIISAIKGDHKKLKELYREGLKKKITLEDKRRIFEDLYPLVIAHSKSEESAMYVPTCREEETKSEAFEGFEEHALVELLMEEMKSEKNDDKWKAKFTVVCELLDHHVDEEEEEYLPKLKDIYSTEQRTKMGEEYQDMFKRLMKAQKSISDSLSSESSKEYLRNH